MILSHRERLQASLVNDPALDRPPVALWRHFPVDDQTAEKLAAATLHFQNDFDFDIVKVSPASSFCLRDWGVVDEWQGDIEGTRHYKKRVIQSPKDWENLPHLDPSAPHLAEQLNCLSLLRREIDHNTPILQTIFNPLSQAKNLAGEELLIKHIRKFPEAVRNGLLTIAHTTRRFVEAAIECGIDGIFFAIQHAQAGLLTLNEYHTFGLSFDRIAFEPAISLWCNLLHIHGEEIYFELVPEYAFPIVNWHDRETCPTLAKAQQQITGLVCGGISRKTLTYGASTDVMREIRDARTQTNDRRFILGTGCVVPIIAPRGNILEVTKSVQKPLLLEG